jgi:cyclase
MRTVALGVVIPVAAITATTLIALAQPKDAAKPPPPAAPAAAAPAAPAAPAGAPGKDAKPAPKDAAKAKAEEAKRFAKVVVKSQQLAPGLFELEGAGGNIGLSVGPDGAFLIDDQFGPLTPKIAAAARKVGGKNIRFVINTHWHGDHTGGNENLGKAGAVIFAHENVRKRMSVEQFVEMKQMTVPPAPAGALPLVTFTSDVTFHLNGDDVRVFHVAPAHTDGDSIVQFVKANVIHMGDTFMTMSYPFVDTSSGGSFFGFITAADQVLALANDQTKIIPGHGVVTDRAALKEWRDMLVTLRDRIGKDVAAGKTLEQVQASKPTAQWDEKLGVQFITPTQIVESIYKALKTKP